MSDIKLTDEEMNNTIVTYSKSADTTTLLNALMEAIAKAQLAKAEPIIRKDEREKAIEAVMVYLDTYYGFQPFASILQGIEAFKEVRNDNTSENS